MGRNRLTTAKPRVLSELERALEQLERVRTYLPEQLSSNEKTILALGAELDRLRWVLRNQPVRQAQADADKLARR
jgi:hydrogenase maturation factor HypF (carbamoyltransferase family)